MKKALLILIASVLLCAVASASADSVVLAHTGQPAPSGIFAPYDIGNGLYFTFTVPVLNSGGQIAFRADLEYTPYGEADNMGIFRVGAEEETVIAQKGLELPSLDGIFDDFSLPTINSFGQVAFWAGADNGRTGIYTGTGAAWPTQVVRENDPAPSGDGKFDKMSKFNLPALDKTGNVTFRAFFKGTVGGSTEDSGIVQTLGSAPKNVAKESPHVSLKSGIDNVAIGEFGEVAFWANTTGLAGGDPLEGIFCGQSFTRLLVEENMVPPDTNGEFSTFDRRPTIYQGHPSSPPVVAFHAYLKNTTGVDDNSGLWKVSPLINSNSPIAQEIAHRGDSPPDGNGQYNMFSTQVSLSGYMAAFFAIMRNSSNPVLDQDGIYRNFQSGPMNETAKIARGGESVPDGNGVLYHLYQPIVNRGGQVAFQASLRDTTGGVTDNEAIYIGDGKILVEVARKGDPLLGSTISNLLFTTGPDYRNGFNKHCQVAYKANLSNGQQAMVLFTPVVKWATVGGGEWSAKDNWTLGIAPDEVHDVVIDPESDIEVLGPWTDITVKSLVIGSSTGAPAALSLLVGGDVTVVNTCTVMPGGAVVIGDGRSFAAGDIVNHGAVTFQSGVGGVFGEAVNGPGGSIVAGAGAEAWMHGPLDNQGVVDVAAGAGIHLAGLTGNGCSGGGTVWLGGEVRAGRCIGVMNFGGNVVFEPGSLTYIGLNAAAALPTHDLIVVEGDLTLGGSLVLESCAAPAWLIPGQRFKIIDVMGTATGRFLGLDEGAQAAIFDGMPLHITYVGGDGNDVELYAVPEPATLALLALGGLALLRRRRK